MRMGAFKGESIADSEETYQQSSGGVTGDGMGHLEAEKKRMIAELRGNKVKQDYYRGEMGSFRYQYDNLRPDRDQFDYEQQKTENMRATLNERRNDVHSDPNVNMSHR